MNSNRFYTALVAIAALLVGLTVVYGIMARWPSFSAKARFATKREQVKEVIHQFIVDVMNQAPSSEAVSLAGAAARQQLAVFSKAEAVNNKELVDSLVHLTQTYASYQQLQGHESATA